MLYNHTYLYYIYVMLVKNSGTRTMRDTFIDGYHGLEFINGQ